MEEWVARVGIDWADKNHAYSVKGTDGSEAAGTMSSGPSGVHEWVSKLRESYPKGIIGVGLEQSRGPLIYALSGYDFLALVPINPLAAKAYRKSRRLSGAKDDPVDAVLIGDFVEKHRSELRVWQPQDDVTRRLRFLTEDRRKSVDARTALTHELGDALKQYFPQALEWFGGESSNLLYAVLSRYPTLGKLQRVNGDVFERLIRLHTRGRSTESISELHAQIRKAIPLSSDEVVASVKAMRVKMLLKAISLADDAIRDYDEVIERVWKEHPDRALFNSFPGAGPVLAPRLAAAFGMDRSRYQEAKEMQTYSGIAPVVEASGKQRWVHSRWQCPKYLKQTFHEFAKASIPFSAWAGAFYREARSRGAGRHAAIRALAFRWIRILFRCWQTGELYDEAKYMARLKAKNSPLAA